ncbi:hypothetical protein HJ590_14095 [Naumannella sp. ID2617S]|uniref:Carboxypeptidase regulatory-like domain-containing protein n=1 Tax=Enemella dayhoffiae TaxID=2016507 RepID=A0A255GT49_9ACTN|nr:hypothetical protein [Enemella dayhoffiae]NNG20667.1 hypothetical protein [Naumannella sp. ID2617S]OYO18642.1 hypothetical protein CGZ93_14570 [Enemella dayhoffiae]
MDRPRAVLAGTVAVLALALPMGVAGPAYANPASTPAAQAPNGVLLEAIPERTTWKLHERVPVNGRLTATGRPIPNATIGLGIDGDVDAQHVTTDADGRWRAELSLDESWGMTEHSLSVFFAGDPNFPAAGASVPITVVADRISPMVLTVAPHPEPVRAGQTVSLTGGLRRDENKPSVGNQIVAVLDPTLNSYEFATTDEQGNFKLELTLPSQAGNWSQGFPRYPVKVRFEGDFWSAVAEQEVMLTLAEPPPVAAPSATPTPTRRVTPAPATPTASPTPVGAAGSEAPPRQVGAMLLPAWLVSRATLMAIGAVLLTLMGAALFSHGRRRHG